MSHCLAEDTAAAELGQVQTLKKSGKKKAHTFQCLGTTEPGQLGTAPWQKDLFSFRNTSPKLAHGARGWGVGWGWGRAGNVAATRADWHYTLSSLQPAVLSDPAPPGSPGTARERVSPPS